MIKRLKNWLRAEWDKSNLRTRLMVRRLDDLCASGMSHDEAYKSIMADVDHGVTSWPPIVRVEGEKPNGVTTRRRARRHTGAGE